MIEHGRPGARRRLAAARTRWRCGTSSSSSATEADGLYIGLGIGEYSDVSGDLRPRLRRRARPHPARGRPARRPTATTSRPAPRAARRAPCSACGLSKRHLFDQAALDGGYDVLVTGHNLDDEAAVLFGNILHWQTDYLGRQLPVLPGPRRLPPEGEAARAPHRAGDGGLLRGAGHRLPRRGVPDGRRQQAPRLQGGAERHRGARHPAPSTTFYFGFLDRAAAHFAPEAEADRARARRLPAPAAPRRPAEVCAFCRLVERAACPRPARPPRCRSSSVPPSRPRSTTADRSRASMSRPFAAGDRVLLIDHKKRRYLVTLKDGGEFHSHAGFVPHDEVIGSPEGVHRAARPATARTSRCARRCRTSCSRCRVARRSSTRRTSARS